MNTRNLYAITLLLLTLCFSAHADTDTPDYRGMVERIDVLLNEGLGLYRKGESAAAKEMVQDAYFQVFENLEGPIRINVSARKNYELEEGFGDIRKQIVRGEPVNAVEQNAAWLLVELHKLLPELEEGVVLVAEGTAGDPVDPAPESKPIEATWRQALEQIRATLDLAIASYENGEGKQARTEILQAQFEGYKNTLLETAIRRYVSHAKDAENNAAFSSMLTLVRNDEGVEALKSASETLVKSLRADLPGLPLVEGAEVMEATTEQASATDWRKVSSQLLGELESALQIYRGGDTETAAGRVQDIYFDTFEDSGMEGTIAARDAALKAEVESHFARMVGQMKNATPPEEVRVTLDNMRGDLDEALELLGAGGESPWSLFLYSLLIILREGFEAILVITALIAYLVKTDNNDKLKVIYNSVGVALGLSVVTAILLEWVFDTSAAQQEILEGATMLLASLVLFSVSYWLISKAEAQKWSAYIKDKMESSLSTGSLAGLWFASFLAVYREGAETVLFYKALTVGAGASGNIAILAGFLIGCVALVAVYWLMRHGAVRLPLRAFFMATGALLYFLAFVFAGKGMMELIEGKLFEPSLIEWMPQWPIVGVYPYWQSLLPQLLLVLAAIAAAIALMRKGNAITAEA